LSGHFQATPVMSGTGHHFPSASVPNRPRPGKGIGSYLQKPPATRVAALATDAIEAARSYLVLSTRKSTPPLFARQFAHPYAVWIAHCTATPHCRRLSIRPLNLGKGLTAYAPLSLADGFRIAEQAEIRHHSQPKFPQFGAIQRTVSWSLAMRRVASTSCPGGCSLLSPTSVGG